MKRLIPLLTLLFLCCVPAGAQTVTQVQHRGCPSGGGTAYTSYTCPLAQGTQTGNFLICLVQVGNTANTISMTDENTSTYTLDKRFNDSNQDYAIFHATPVAGTHIPVVNVSGGGSAFQQFSCAEYNNITAVDVCSAGASSSGTAVNAGSLTPTVTGDLLVQIAGNESGSTVATWAHVTHANITWGWQQNDRGYVNTNLVAQAVQWGQYASTAAITSSMTLGSSLAWGSVACSYKSGSAGTARPGGAYISSLEHYNIPSNATPAVFNIPFDTGNNLGVLALINSSAGGANPRISSITQSGTGSTNTWSKAGDVADSNGSGYMMIWYCQNCSFGDDSTISVALNAGNTYSEAEMIVYGISSMKTSGVLDTGITSSNGTCTSGFCNLTGTQAVGASPISTLTVTPGAANGITIGAIGVNSPQIRGVSSGSTDTAYSPQEASTLELDENNGRAHNTYSTASAFTFSWTTGGAALNGWQAIASNFLAASAATNFPQVVVIRP